MSTLNYMFWGYLAAFILIAGYVARLALRVRALEERSERLRGQGSKES